MKELQTITQLPGYRLFEYLLVLSPHEELWKRIREIRNEFGAQYKVPVNPFKRPHLTLVKFINRSMAEEKILHRLQLISMGITPFKVECEDFGSFPSHSIFINVTTKLAIQNLVKEIRSTQQLMKLNNENKPHFIDEPHFTIAQSLKPWQYEGGWADFSQRSFTGRFIADSMLLLKRIAGENGGFQIAKRFEFQNLPVTTRQGSLFSPLPPEGGT
jgi:2'-5' RNA ligase